VCAFAYRFLLTLFEAELRQYSWNASHKSAHTDFRYCQITELTSLTQIVWKISR